MIAYVDSSVVLRVVLGQPKRWREWPSLRIGISSTLLRVECLRTLDRIRLRGTTGDEELAEWRDACLRIITSFRVVELDPTVLSRAAEPMPTSLGTLDAIHLATALLWRDKEGKDLLFATHDGSLATAALAHGFKVVGV